MTPRMRICYGLCFITVAAPYCMGQHLNHRELDRRFSSLVPFTRVPFWVPIFDPQPNGPLVQQLVNQQVAWAGFSKVLICGLRSCFATELRETVATCNCDR